jgi:hypothetical protein
MLRMPGAAFLESGLAGVGSPKRRVVAELVVGEALRLRMSSVLKIGGAGADGGIDLESRTPQP